jgi:hypothetical protein
MMGEKVCVLSPEGIQIALTNEGLMSEFRRLLPDRRPQDTVLMVIIETKSLHKEGVDSHCARNEISSGPG